MSKVNENALDAQRSDEDSDLLERSTRKRKVSGEVSGAAAVNPTESTSLENPLPAAVDVVAETPTDETNIQIESDGVPVSGAGLEPPSPIAGALPRSYLDSVVASERDHPMTEEQLSQAHNVAPVVHTNVGTSAAPKTKPYGSWMLVTRKERRPPAQKSGPSPRAPVGGAGVERGVAGSRYAPLETEEVSDAVPVATASANPSRRPDKQPVASAASV
nr:hypothetical protein Iba_chr06aCG17970 [Ipomoea batatas]